MTANSHRAQEYHSLRDGQVLRFQHDPLSGLTQGEREHVTKYLNVMHVGHRWMVSKRVRYAGLVPVGGATFWLEPPFSPGSFVYLLLRHRGLDSLAQRAYSLASNRRNRSISDLMQVLALLMVDEARTLASGHIAQSYVSRTERIGVVKGRPIWHKQGGRPADGRVLCRYDEKSTDVLENRLVLAGLDRAARWLNRGPAASTLRTQAFLWHSIAEPLRPAQHDFDTAELRLNRLTDAYRPALAISRALHFGFDLSDRNPNTRMIAPAFDLAVLFETLVELLSRTAFTGTDVTVAPQMSERRAILTRSGQAYRTIRPDLVFERHGRPIYVADSKFKPRYAQGGPVPPARNRVTREDIFQTFFYSHRVAQRAGLASPIPAAVIAPRLTDEPLPEPGFRDLRWGEDLERGPRLTLMFVPVDETVQALIRNDVAYCRDVLGPTNLFGHSLGIEDALTTAW